MVEIDELYKYMYNQNIFTRHHLFNPTSLNEPICIQANESEINHSSSFTTLSFNSKIHEATVTYLNYGLKFIYLNLKQSTESLKQLDLELANETSETLVQLELKELQLNAYYILRYNRKMYRCLLVTLSNEEAGQNVYYGVYFIDSGNRITFTAQDNVKFYVMMTKYFKYNTFALHCRLPFANSIEKVWLKVSYKKK